MSLKKLSFPIFVIVIVFIGAFSVKPTVDSVLENRKNLKARADELAAVEATRRNLDMLSASRDSLLTSDEGTTVYGYLPVSFDQERIVDVFNFYAMQSGAVINDIAFMHKATPASVSPAVSVDGNVDDAALPPVPPVPGSFTMHASIQGSYESLRSFFKSVSHPGRSYALTSFSIEKKGVATDANGQAVADTGMLSGTFSADFFYLPEKSYPRGYLLPVFGTGAFDLASVRELIAEEKAVPELPVPGDAGRGNPFSFQ
ncbi:MAG TPA: hypothetical protein VN420_02980 [Candidatus Fimivivens sp.]|nr:hypothetical protein [Candidatus Fimivivens sp.]